MASLMSIPRVVSTTGGTGILEGVAPRTRCKTKVAPTARAEDDRLGARSMQVLVAFGDEYRAYREAIARAIQALRPSTRVTITPLESVTAKAHPPGPRVVICARHSDGTPDRNTTWVTVPTEPGVPASISSGSLLRKVEDLSLTELLTVLDEAEGVPPHPGDRRALP